MLAIVTTNFLGDPKSEKRLRARVQQFFEQYPDDWTVSILGAQDTTAWKLKVTASDGQTTWVHTLHGEDGSHDIEKILEVLMQISVRFPPRAAAG